MLVIRLARTGRAKYPTYRIVAAESTRAATGRFVSVLGHYNPHTKELVVNREEAQKHLGNGAQPSPSVVKLLQREGVELPKWVKVKSPKPKPKADEAQPSAAADETDVTPEEAAAEAGDGAEGEEERVATTAEEHAENVGQNEVAEVDPADTSTIQTAADAARDTKNQQDIDAAAEQIAKNAAEEK